jgi:hypothetical protein
MKQVLPAATAIALICTAGYVMAQTAAPRAPAAQGAPRAPTAEGVSSPTSEGNPVAPATQADRDTELRLARMDTSIVAFHKLDKDNDGRISPLEAADNPKVAAAFSLADKDKDGYLSPEEFQSLGTAHPRDADVAASSPSTGKATDPSGDRPATSPQATPPQP